MKNRGVPRHDTLCPPERQKVAGEPFTINPDAGKITDYLVTVNFSAKQTLTHAKLRGITT